MVNFCFSDERFKTIDDVLHILGLVRNLISMFMFNDLTMHVTFENLSYRLVRGSLMVAKGSQIRSLLCLHFVHISTKSACMLCQQDWVM